MSFVVIPSADGFTITESIAVGAVANADALAEELVASSEPSWSCGTQRELVKKFIQLAYLRGFNAGFKP